MPPFPLGASHRQTSPSDAPSHDGMAICTPAYWLELSNVQCLRLRVLEPPMEENVEDTRMKTSVLTIRVMETNVEDTSNRT
jgi:hypothetical protein